MIITISLYLRILGGLILLGLEVNIVLNYLVDFYNKHKNWPKKKTIIEKIESSISVDMNIKTVLDWFLINPPISSKGSIDFLEFRIKARQNFDKKGEIIKIWTTKI